MCTICDAIALGATVAGIGIGVAQTTEDVQNGNWPKALLDAASTALGIAGLGYDQMAEFYEEGAQGAHVMEEEANELEQTAHEWQATGAQYDAYSFMAGTADWLDWYAGGSAPSSGSASTSSSASAC